MESADRVILQAHTHSLYGRAFCSLGRPIDMLTLESCIFFNVCPPSPCRRNSLTIPTGPSSIRRQRHRACRRRRRRHRSSPRPQESRSSATTGFSPSVRPSRKQYSGSIRSTSAATRSYLLMLRLQAEGGRRIKLLMRRRSTRGRSRGLRRRDGLGGRCCLI
jgi:hypothetical protein